jgi:hypothetical protein
MQSGIYNVYWWLSYAAPLVIMFIACATRARWVYRIGLACSFVATWNLNFLAVTTKWTIRNTTAVTADDIAHATADGANIVFSAIALAPLEALVLTLLFAWIGRKIWKPKVSKSESTIARAIKTTESPS